MNLEISTHNWKEVDTAELAQVMLTAKRYSPFWRPNLDLDWFQRFIQQRIERFAPSFVILARRQDRVVGMMGVITADPAIYDVWRWNPFVCRCQTAVLPDEGEKEIAVKLITACIQQMQAAGVQRLEAGFDFNKDEITLESEAYYQKYSSWYELAGAAKLEEFVYMTIPAANFSPLSQNLLEDSFTIRPLDGQAKDDLYNCFSKAFSAGNDRSFLGRNEHQRRKMFDDYFSDPADLNTAASLVLSKDREVIGFTLFQTRPYVGDEHLALMCIHPDHQGKKLGKQLLSLSMAKVAAQGDKLMSLGVDLDNPAAYQLYLKAGFEVQSKFITQVWQQDAVHRA